MNIALCSDSFIPIIDGVGTVVKAYAETLAKKENDVYVLTPTDNTGYRGRLPFEIVDYTSFQMSKRLPWKVGMESIDSHFAERCRMLDLDIIHAHTPGTSCLVAMKLSKKKGIPLVGSFHSKYYDDILKITHNKAVAKVGSRIIADFYNQCDEVWAVSENAAEELRSYGCKSEIIIMPNGTDIRVLNANKTEEVVARFGLKRNIPVLLFVGQINWKKNILRILESCSIIKKDGYDFQLVLAGRGPDEKAIKKQAVKLGLEDNLIMTGHLEDTEVLDCLYAVSDLFLFPSVYDNAPMVLREAAVMHTPSVVVENTGAAEVITDMENGLVCKDDSCDLANRIEQYLGFPEEEKTRIRDSAFRTIPIPWDGSLADGILNRYGILIEKNRMRK